MRQRSYIRILGIVFIELKRLFISWRSHTCHKIIYSIIHITAFEVIKFTAHKYSVSRNMRETKSLPFVIALDSLYCNIRSSECKHKLLQNTTQLTSAKVHSVCFVSIQPSILSIRIYHLTCPNLLLVYSRTLPQSSYIKFLNNIYVTLSWHLTDIGKILSTINTSKA